MTFTNIGVYIFGYGLERMISFNHITSKGLGEIIVGTLGKESNNMPELGLVRALLAIPKHKEALYTAREAMRTMAHLPKFLLLVGDVYAHTPDGREKVCIH